MYKSLLLFLFSFSFWISIGKLSAQCVGTPSLNLYWIGSNGSGNFNDPENWRVGNIASLQKPCQSPRSSDNIYFVAAAFPTTGATITIDMNSNCANMIWDNYIPTSPSLAGTLDKNLEVYGSFTLADQGSLNFNYNGALIFKGAGTNTYDLNTKGHNLRVYDFKVNLDNNATLRLTSPLVVNNINNNNASSSDSRVGGVIYHLTGHFNTNGQPLDIDGFISENYNPAKRITFNNSKINLKSAGWYPDIFRISSINNANFSATGSHIIIEDSPITYLTDHLTFGGDILFDSVTVRTNISRIHWGGKLFANYLHVAGKGTTLNNANFEVNTLQLDPGIILVLTGGEIAFDNLINSNNCSDYAFIQASMNNAQGSIRKKTPGHLSLNNLILQKISANTSNGSTYSAINSFDVGYVNNIAITAPIGCPSELYFRQTVDNNWHSPENWYDIFGNQIMQIPNPNTNVFFNSNSGFGNIVIDRNVAYCNNITWLNDINVGINLIANYTLAILGNATFSNRMGYISGSVYGHEISSGLSLYGQNKTFASGTTPIHITINMTGGSDYTFLDSIYAQGINMNAGSMMRANNIGLNLARFTMGNRVLSNTRLYTRGVGWPLIDQSSADVVTYTDSCIFYITDAGPLGPQTIQGLFPHTVFNTAGDIGANIHVLGNLYIQQSTNLSFRTGSEFTFINVTGNSILTPGIEVTLSGNAGSFWITQGNFTAIGSCTSPTTIKTHNGNPIHFEVGNIANIQNSYLKGLRSITPIIAINSTDGTGNSNITFSNSGTTTFYWRAHYSDPNLFTGNWSNPAHWTTDPLKLTGDSACIPSLTDDVVFDLLSYSAFSNGCTIDGQAYCRNFTATDNNIIRANTLDRMWYIGGSFNISNSVNLDTYQGSINMVGEGIFDFNTHGRKLYVRDLRFDNINGTWNINSSLELDDLYSWEYSGRMILDAGTINTNGNNLIIHNTFFSETNKSRSLNFSNSKITMVMSGYYRAAGGIYNRPWSITDANTMNLIAGELEFLDGSNSVDINIRFGDGLRYGVVKITDAEQAIKLFGDAHVQFAEFNSSLNFYNNMSFDSLGVYGGKTYIFQSGNRQTLASPHGKIISYGTSSSFINLQSSSIGSKTYFYKDYGNGFCVDFLKVQDVIAQRQNDISLVPAPYDISHLASLFFDTGENCDDINGSATDDPSSIWRFSLQPLETPRYIGGNSMQLCSYTSLPATISIPIIGTSPYVIEYTWTTGSINGNGVLTAYDDDNNTTTPYYADIPLHTLSSNIQYTFKITTYRCGEATASIGSTVHVQQPLPNPLTMIAQTSSCYFNNEDHWRTLFGSTNDRPILSINDYTGSGDIAALTTVTANVNFTPSIQEVNIGGVMYPYLERYWRITPNNNTRAKVRLYFTQAELNNLANNAYSFTGSQTGTLDASMQIQVVKYTSGIVGVGPYEFIPHNVIPLVGATASPFTTTTGVIAIEFNVNDFSAFIITPNQSALLSMNLNSFEVRKTDKENINISWAVENTSQIEFFELEHILNSEGNNLLVNYASNRLESIDQYEYLHLYPKQGYNYYRLKSISDNGDINYSVWKTVEIKGQNNNINLYPNPTTGEVTIQLPSSNQLDIILYNQLGQVVFTEYNVNIENIYQFNIHNLPEGIYTAQIILTDGYTKTINIIKK